MTRAEFKFGAGAGLDPGQSQRRCGAATPPNLSGDIIIWTSGKGLYGGLTLNGSVVKARDEWNTAFYGKPALGGDILADRVQGAGANPIRQQLSR